MTLLTWGYYSLPWPRITGVHKQRLTAGNRTRQSEEEAAGVEEGGDKAEREDGTDKQDDPVPGNEKRSTKDDIGDNRELDGDNPDLGQGGSSAKKSGDETKVVDTPVTPVLDDWLRNYLPWAEP